MSSLGRRILVNRPLSDADRERVAAAAGDCVVLFASPDEVDLGSLDAIIGEVGSSDLVRATRVGWLHSGLAGVDRIITPALLDRSIVLTSSVGTGAVPLAEHAIMLMLMLDRDAPRWVRAQGASSWDPYLHGELAGRTLGIVGLGLSGLDLAGKARAFHMRVLGTRRDTGRPAPGVDRVYPPEELHSMLPQCDVVVVTAPLTPATVGMFGYREFALMPDHAMFVCISRGGIVVDSDLLRALDDGQLAGAGLDAHGQEPLPPSSPFWSHPRVIVTPHSGASSFDSRVRGVEILIENVRRYARGDRLINIVDLQAGY